MLKRFSANKKEREQLVPAPKFPTGGGALANAPETKTPDKKTKGSPFGFRQKAKTASARFSSKAQKAKEKVSQLTAFLRPQDKQGTPLFLELVGISCVNAGHAVQQNYPRFCKVFVLDPVKSRKNEDEDVSTEENGFLLCSSDVAEGEVNPNGWELCWNTHFQTEDNKVLKFEICRPGYVAESYGECSLHAETIALLPKGQAHTIQLQGGEVTGCTLTVKVIEPNAVAIEETPSETESETNSKEDSEQRHKIGELALTIENVQSIHSNRSIYVTASIGLGNPQQSETQTLQSNKNSTQTWAINWSSKHDVQDVTADLKIYVWEVHHLQSNKCIGQVVLPLTDFTSRWSPKPSQVLTLQLAPYVEPKTYNRFGQYRKPVTGSNYPGFGLDHPVHTLGIVTASVELKLETILPNAYLASQPDAEILKAIPMDHIDFSLGELKLNIKRLERWPRIFKQTMQSMLNWKQRPFTVLVITALHTYLCFFAKPWQFPLIGFVAFLTVGCMQKRSFAYTKVWKDEATPEKLSKAKSIEQKYKRIWFLGKKISKKTGNSASSLEKMINIWTWANFQISFLVFLAVGAFCSILSLVLLFIPVHWTIFALGLGFIISGGGRFPLSTKKKVSTQNQIHSGILLSHGWTDGYHGDSFTGYRLEQRFCELYLDPPILRTFVQNPSGEKVVESDIDISGAELFDNFKVDLFENEEILQAQIKDPSNNLEKGENQGRKLVFVLNLTKKGKDFLYLGIPSLKEKKDWVNAIQMVLNGPTTKKSAKGKFGAMWETLNIGRSHLRKPAAKLKNLFALAPDDFDLEHQVICRKLSKVNYNL